MAWISASARRRDPARPRPQAAGAATFGLYRETLEARGAHGFHHWAIGARDFEATVAHDNGQGYATVFSDISPRGVRIVYVDTSAVLPGMLEIIEMTPDVEEQYRTMHQSAQEWDAQSHVVHRLQPKQPA